MEEKRKKNFWIIPLSALILLGLSSIGGIVSNANAIVTAYVPVSGYVYNCSVYGSSTAARGIAGAYVDVFATAYDDGNAGGAANVQEVRTDSTGHYSVKMAVAANRNGCSGSYITVRAYLPNLRQLETDPSFQPAWGGSNLYTTVPCGKLTMDIPMVDYTGSTDKLYYVGLRESYYGLTRPYGDMVTYPVMGVPNAKSMLYPTGAMTTNLVKDWQASVMVNGYHPQKRLHVVIVTQTDPTTFALSYAAPAPGATPCYRATWNATNGPTYLLWKRGDTDSSASSAPANAKFLDDVCDLYCNPMSNDSRGQYQIDTVLSYYDQAGEDVYLQIESGYIKPEWIVPAVLNRFYKNQKTGVVKHPCVKGLGVDVEWYKNTNPFDNSKSEAMSVGDGTKFLGLVKGFNPQLRLYLKHYMLSDEDDGTVDGINAGNFKDIIYVDDTQQEVQPGDAMSTGITNNSWEYQNWAHTYSPADVVFQTGYDSAGFETCSVPTDMQGIRDVRWWALLQNPIQDIMQATFNYNYDGDVFPQEPGRQYSVVWVDFSARSNIGSLNIFNAKTKTMDPNNRMSVHVNPPPLGHWPLSCIY